MSNPIKRRGLGSLPLEQRKAIASMGGKAAHIQGVAHQFTSEEARQAARIGHISRRRNRQAQGEE